MATGRAERRLAAVLAADVVGYSRLMERDEQGTLERLKLHRKELIDPLQVEHRGRIVKLMGDGALVEFASVVDAVACAVAIQEGMAGRELDVPKTERIRFRIGINLGDVIVEGEDIYGDGVNVAARLEQLCEPGGVLISGTAYDQLQGKLGLPLDFVGEQQVKNMARPVRLYRVRLDGVRVASRRTPWRFVVSAAAVVLALAIAAGAWWLWPSSTAITAHPSIAVLPFDNLGGDNASGRLANGITEDIITDLSRFREFDVIARNSTEIYAGKPVDVREVGKDLNVRYVLEGSIQLQADRVRVTAQLVDAGTGAHVWSERWDRPAEDVFAVQTEIAEQIAGQLGGWGVVVDAIRGTARRARPGDLTAYELYLKGIDALQHHTKESVVESVRLFAEAVENDPNLARAWTALSTAYDYSVSLDAGLDAAEEKAKEAAERAAALDPLDADAHRALGEIVGALGDLKRAQAEFETAVRLNPGDASILANYASWASVWGPAERGAEAADRAIRLNPNFTVGTANRLRTAYFWAGRYEDALRMVERQPVESRTTGGWVMYAASLAALGRTEAARAAVTEALTRRPGLSIQSWLSAPDLTADDRRLLERLMRAAGFPICAKPEDLAKLKSPFRLPECSGSA